MTEEAATDPIADRLPVADGRSTWTEVWRTTRGHRLQLVCVIVLGVLSATAGLVFPAAVGSLVDGVQAGTATLSTIWWMLGVTVAAAVVGAAGTALTVVLAARTYHAMLADLRERLVKRAMTLPQSVVERAGTGDLVSRSSDDVAQIADAAPQIIPAFSAAGFTIAVTVVGMAALDWWYGLALLVTLPVYVLTVRWYLRTAPQIYAAERSAMSGRAQQLLESQRGYDTIAGLNLGEHRHLHVLRASWAVAGHSLRARTVQNMFFGRLNFAEYLGLAAILLAGYWLVTTGQSTVGLATAATLLFLRLFGPIGQLLLVVDVLQSVAASLHRIVGVITVPDLTPPSGANTGERTPAGFTSDDDPLAQLSDVSFSYDGHHPVLEDINLTIAPEERVAVVGASGAGKTTLATILTGTHHPDSGTVSTPERTAVITQEVHVFAGTVRENLTLAAPDATDEQLRAAIETTRAATLIDLLPEGLETPVGASGQDLTPAQAQQLALTRLVLVDSELAVLDEATAEAGSTDADLLDQAAFAATADRAAVMIAHRLSQAAACDRILVMDGGRITESGSHAELVNQGGTYANLWQAWSDGQAQG